MLRLFIVHRKGATVGGLDGWCWREFKAQPVFWFDGLVRIFSKVEDTGVWLEGLLDAFFALIPKTDGDATPLGQRPLSVLPIAYRIWASARMLQLEDWLRSRVPDSVFGASGGRGSVEAWYTTALDVEEVLSGLLTLMFIFLLLMLLSPLIRWIGAFWVGCSVVWCFLVGFAMLILSITRMFGFGLSWLLGLVNLGLGIVVFLRGAL